VVCHSGDRTSQQCVEENIGTYKNYNKKRTAENYTITSLKVDSPPNIIRVIKSRRTKIV